MKAFDSHLDEPIATYFMAPAGAFAIVYTSRGKVLSAWFVPRPEEGEDE